MSDTFPGWLAKHATQDNAMGDLARDVAQDIRDGWTGFTIPGELLDRMDQLGACENAMATARRAVRAYAKASRGEDQVPGVVQ